MTYSPCQIIGETRQSRFLITCDHAANIVPPDLGGSLGLPVSDMARHIAYDVGAAGMARELGELLDAPVVLSNFSRLVIDPNRGEDDPTLLMKLYDGSVIPGNRHADPEEKERRLNAYYRPYDAALAKMVAGRDDVAIVAIHSFTPQLHGRPPRPWHVGVLHAAWDARLSDPLIDMLEAEPDLVVGRNQPYPGHLPGDAIDRHALGAGRLNTLIEVRNDLIEEEVGQRHWAARLAPLLQQALAAVTEKEE
ncbi:N-formylglutamate amidohydrolase [Mameliella alba]|uniref:N-formylglutamate amidohydrolase n=1 Tax=Mameliella alba TaxID=561184 RepID=UPI0013E4F8BE|nr:N-formylglutamate amidohydrolase [Mameliella alba]BBU54600.1 N-formylglutamate amidohydrolase [Mameliella alba]